MNRTVNRRRPPAPPPRPTPGRKHLTKHQREQRLRRVLIVGTATVLALVLLVPLFGYYREVLTKASQPVAYVDGAPIELGPFAKLYGLQLAQLDANIEQMRAFSAQSASVKPENDIFAQQIQRLEAQRGELDQTILTEMVEHRLIAAEAARRGITVSPEEEDAELRERYSDPATPTPNPATPSPTVAADATPSPSAVPTVDPMERFRNQLANQRWMTEQEYRDLLIRPALLREKLTATFPGEPEVRARHVLVETEEAARAAKERLEKGDSFEVVAQELSKDESNKENGGDLGWFPRGRMVKPFEDVAFALPIGQVSDPVKSDFGWHVIKVEEKRESRAPAFDKWLEEAKNEAFARETVKFDLSDDEVTWARNQMNKARGLPPER